MAKNDKMTHLMKKAAPFIAGLAGDVNHDTVDKDLEALVLALNTHKTSADHDGIAHIWTALNKFLQAVEVNGVLPVVGDTSDIGSATQPFRKGFFSELSTLLFKKENVLVMDGSLVLTKQSGKFEIGVLASDIAIDFGQVMTPGDYLLLRAENKMEYIQVGTVREEKGTIYNVTRDLDGSGANDWPAGSVYFVRGHAGDGWLELTASGEQRFSVFLQGAEWNTHSEVIRIGELNGWQSSPITGYGIVIGDYAANEFLVYSDVDKKLKLSGEITASDGATKLGLYGIFLKGLGTGLNIYTDKADTISRASIQLLFDPGNPDITWLQLREDKDLRFVIGKNYSPFNEGNFSVVVYGNPSTGKDPVSYVMADGKFNLSGSLIVDNDATIAGTIKDGDGVLYGRPVFLTTPLTSTSWDGDLFSTTDKTLIDMSAVFGVPAGVKAVILKIAIRDSGSASSSPIFQLSGISTGTNYSFTLIASEIDNRLVYATPVVPCDENGDLYYSISASGAGTMYVHMTVWGYWL